MSGTTAWPCCDILEDDFKAPTDHSVMLCSTPESNRFDLRFCRMLLHKSKCLLALQRCTFSGSVHAVYL